MRRRRSWLERILIGIVLLILIGYVALALTLPPQLAWVLRQAAGDAITVGQVRVGFPLKLILSDVSVAQANPGTVVSSRQVVIVPQWLSWRKKTVWIRSLQINEPRIQLRRTRNGALSWPFPPSLPSHAPPGSSQDAVAATAMPAASWQVAIETIHVSDGTVEFVDEKLGQPFRGFLTDLSFVGGPMAVPPQFDRISLAIQGRFVGDQQHGASVYCSGWGSVKNRDLDLSCQLEPLRLAAFEPYYHGPVQVRVYDATLKATSHLTAKANDLKGRVQLEIDNLSEADLSVLGTTLVDIKKVTGGAGGTLTGEVQISGPLDQPAQWRFQLVPGNDIVQRLVNPLLGRGIEIIRIKVGTQTLPVGIAPASEAVMSGIEAVTKQVQEALAIIAPATPAVETPTSEAPPAEPAPAPGPPAEQPRAPSPAPTIASPQPSAPSAEQPASEGPPSEPASAASPP